MNILVGYPFFCMFILYIHPEAFSPFEETEI